MAYQASVTSRITLATTTSTSANLSSTLILTPNQYFAERCLAFNSFEEVTSHAGITVDGVAYNALKMAFNAPNAAVPIWLGRQACSSTSFRVADSYVAKTYSLSISVGSAVTAMESAINISYTSTTSETSTEVAIAIAEAISDRSISGITVATPTSDTFVVASTAAYTVITNVTNLLEVAFVTNETVAEAYANVMEENEEDFYFLTCTDHTSDSILALAALVETSESSDYPKIYLPATQDANTLYPEVDPAIDIVGKLKEFGYNRTAITWHDQADTLYPEAFTSAYIGQFAAGSTNWKFVKAVGFSAAADLDTGVALSTAKQGYISDRNGSWYGKERGITFNHGGTMASGEWIDVIRFKDWINDQIEVRVQDHLINLSAAGSKASFTKADINSILSIVDGVLQDGVDVGGLTGYIGAAAPSTISFENQANRILEDITWTGYLAGAINFIVVDGVLTYSEDL